jgi:ABC-type enterochelin transport system substrate-binding protein
MGFSLKKLFEDLELILDKDQKAAKTVRELAHEIQSAKQYAEQCGQLRDR